MYSIIRRLIGYYINFVIFIPFYFNILHHARFFLAPWKSIIFTSDKKRGFAFSQWLERAVSNAVSRAIGALMRAFLIITAFVLLVLLVIAAPLYIVLIFIISPFIAFLQMFFSKKRTYEYAKEKFIKTHVLKKKHESAAAALFKEWWMQKQKERDFFSLNNLLSIPPIGRDWTYGFTPILDKYIDDLGHYEQPFPVIGRKNEIQQLSSTLARSNEANAVLIGEEGIGKHSIINAFASLVYKGKVAAVLINKRVVMLKMGKILAHEKDLVSRSAWLSQLLDEAQSAGNIIIVIDEIHKYCTDRLMGDYTSIWQKYGSGKNITFVGITTGFYYQKIIAPNSGLTSLFHPVHVSEVSGDSALRILFNTAQTLEQKNNCVIFYETLATILEASGTYVIDIPFPEKALDLLYEAVSAAAADNKNKRRVLPSHVAQALSQKIQVPIGPPTKLIKEKLVLVPRVLKQHILGQEHAVRVVSEAIQESFLRQIDARPRSSMLLMGPTGVGKTETARALAKLFFKSAKNMMRFDMSFYQTDESIAQLIGSLNGNEIGQLAQSIREHPNSILLVDEIEKAPKKIRSLFLTMLDEGYIIDGYGKKVDCRNLIIVATSNAGAEKVIELSKNENIAYENLVGELRLYLEEKGLFAPEFINRFDALVVYVPLSKQAIFEIGRKTALRVSKDYERQYNIKVYLADDEIASIASKYTDEHFNARDIERIIRREIGKKITKHLL